MKRILLLLTAFATLLACTKYDPNPVNPDVPDPNPKPDTPTLEIPEGVTLNYSLEKNTIFFSKEEGNDFQKIDDTHIKVSGDKILSVGQIILCASTSQNPSGFLGRVVAVNGTKASEATLTTEPVSLEEAFESLEIKGSIDLAEYIDSLEDEEGNILQVDKSDSNSDVWDTLDESEEEEESETKAPSVLAKTFSVNFKSEFIEGTFYSQTRSEVNIVYKKGEPMKCTMVFNEKTGLDGTLNLKAFDKGNDTPILRKGIHVPIGPVVLNPQITFNVGYSLKGENHIKGEIKTVLSNSETTISNSTGEYKTTSKNLGRSFDLNVTLWESKGLISLWAETALRYCVMNEAILSFGLGVRAHNTFEGSVSFDINKKDLLSVNPSITRTIGIDAFAYVYSSLFKQDCERYEITIPVASVSGQFSLLTSCKGSIKTEPSLIIVSPNFSSKDKIMKETGIGVALFKKGSDTPMVKKPIKASGSTKADTESDSAEDISFDITGNSSSYEVKAYVTTNEGIDYYKSLAPRVKKVICSITGPSVGGISTETQTFEYSYDGDSYLPNSMLWSDGYDTALYKMESTNNQYIVKTDWMGITINKDSNGIVQSIDYIFEDGDILRRTTGNGSNTSNLVKWSGGPDEAYINNYYECGNKIKDDHLWYRIDNSFETLVSRTYEYYDEYYDNFNIDYGYYISIPSLSYRSYEEWIKLEGHSSKNLIKKCIQYMPISNHRDEYDVTYDFDREGRVKKIYCLQTGYGSVRYEITFEYIE